MPATGTKRLSFLKKAEDMVAETKSEDPRTTDEIDAQRELQDARMGLRHDPEYKAKNRAEVLRSMEVVRDFSPSEGLTLKRPSEDWPWGYRFCNPETRKNMLPWVPLDATIPAQRDEAMKVCISKRLRVQDGVFMSGELVLCRAPWAECESMAALAFQRSQRRMTAAASGNMTPETGQSAMAPTNVPSLQRLAAASKSGLGDIGIRMKGSLEDDPSV